MNFIVEVSARHVHLSKEDAEAIFGAGYELKVKRPLSQHGQFLSEEKVDIKCGEKMIKNISVLGPYRATSQVEISKTDSFTLKTACPVRESGDIENSPAVTIIGTTGEVTLNKGLIIAKRHIHMTPADAQKFSVKDKDIVSVAVKSENRSIVFGDTVVRVNPEFALAMHIDTDEANAADVSINGATGKIIKLEEI